jgi:hypothetical protein
VTSKVSVDRERLHDVLDRMRAELPEAVARTRIGPSPAGCSTSRSRSAAAT